MMELVDILEAFGQQGLIGCGAVSKVPQSVPGIAVPLIRICR